MYPAYHYRYRRYYKIRPTALWPLLLTFILINCLVIYAFFFTNAGQGLFSALLAWNDRDPKLTLQITAPLLVWSEPEKSAELFSVRWLSMSLVGAVHDQMQHPENILAYQIPFLAETNELNGPDKAEEPASLATAPIITPQQDEEPDQDLPIPLTKECLAAIYNTHTGETYALTDGTERLTGKRGGVVTAAQALQEELEKRYGIQVARSETINDESYNEAYAVSQITLQTLLEENPNVQVVLDIHRDAGKSRAASLATVNGQEVAPVLIIVGSDARSPFPTWQQNYSFAQELADEIDKQYPGLCLGVRIKEGRYNQFLHPRAVLLEIGCVNNSTEEAIDSARMLAGPVAELIKRNMDTEQE